MHLQRQHLFFCWKPINRINLRLETRCWRCLAGDASKSAAAGQECWACSAGVTQGVPPHRCHQRLACQTRPTRTGPTSHQGLCRRPPSQGHRWQPVAGQSRPPVASWQHPGSWHWSFLRTWKQEPKVDDCVSHVLCIATPFSSVLYCAASVPRA